MKYLIALLLYATPLFADLSNEELFQKAEMAFSQASVNETSFKSGFSLVLLSCIIKMVDSDTSAITYEKYDDGGEFHLGYDEILEKWQLYYEWFGKLGYKSGDKEFANLPTNPKKVLARQLTKSWIFKYERADDNKPTTYYCWVLSR